MSFDNFSKAPSLGHLDFKQDLVADMEPTWRCPPEWAEGPIRNPKRGCTDGYFLAFFLFVLFAMTCSSIYAYYYRDPQGIGKMYDSSGNVCGQGDAAGYSALFLQTFQAPYKSVCVDRCPVFDYNQARFNSTGVSSYKVSEAIPFMGIWDFSETFAGPSYTNSTELTPKEAFTYNQNWANNYFSQEQFENYVLHKDLKCFPNRQFDSCYSSSLKPFYIYDSQTVLDRICAPVNPKSAMLYNRVTHRINNSDLLSLFYALPLFTWVAFAVLFLSFMFILFTIFCTGLMTFCLFFILSLSLICVGFIFVLNLLHTGAFNDPFNALRLYYLQFLMSYKILLTVLGGFCIFLGFWVLCYMCKFRKYITASAELIKIASKSSLKNCMLVFLSFFILFLQVCVFFFEVYIIAVIYTCGEENTNKQDGMPFAQY